jgi:hypothetical protein
MPSLIALFPRQVKGIQTLIFALKLGHLLTEEFHYMNGQSTGSVQKIPSPILRHYFSFSTSSVKFSSFADSAAAADV